MKLTEKINKLNEKDISKSDLSRIETLLDKLFAALNIDIEFTRHFHDRLNDPRNGKPITLDELAKLYVDVFKAYGKRIAKLPDEAEAVMKDMASDVNVPFVLDYNDKSGLIELIAKTVMRKRDFKSKTRFYKVGRKNEMKLTNRIYNSLGMDESINDKNILKAIILAGGPGAGKSFVIDNIIGKEGPVSGLGAVISSSDKFFEARLLKLGLPMKFGEEGTELYRKQMDAREVAKAVAKTRLNHILDGMLPVVLDGTGQNLAKIKKQKIALENIGYDVDMIFVNTSLEVAQERNRLRDRSLLPKVVQGAWESVQHNIGEFQSIFGNARFHLIDNSRLLEGKELKAFKQKMFKMGMKLFNQPVKNPRGKALIKALQSVNGKYISDLKKLEDVPV